MDSVYGIFIRGGHKYGFILTEKASLILSKIHRRYWGIAHPCSFDDIVKLKGSSSLGCYFANMLIQLRNNKDYLIDNFICNLEEFNELERFIIDIYTIVSGHNYSKTIEIRLVEKRL